MAIAFDAATNGGHATDTSLTFAHTCTGDDRFLWVLVGNAGHGSGDVISGVTYNGVAMTLAAKKQYPATSNWIYMFGLAGPASGANNIVISTSATSNIYGLAASYTGVSQTGQPDATNSNSAASATSLTDSVTTSVDNSWAIMIAASVNAAATLTAGTGTTRRVLGDFSFLSIMDSNGPISPAGSTSLQFTSASSDNLYDVIASIAPVGAGFIDNTRPILNAILAGAA